jgi:glycosyltransferase involved in cell wall biosynthesis
MLLADFWRLVREDLEFVVCVRNPFEVGLSLQRRGLMSPLLGMSLWATYYERLLQTTERTQRIVVDYDTFLFDPLGCLQSLAARLNLVVTEEELRNASAVADPLQRHHDTASPGAELLPPAVADIYAQLLAEAADRPGGRAAKTRSLPLPTSVVRRKGGALVELTNVHQQALAVSEDRDRWRERAGRAEHEQATLNERLEAERGAWEGAAEEALGAIQQLEARLRGEVEQLALDRDRWRTCASEYEQDRDRWRGRAGVAEQEQVALREGLEAALAAGAVAETQREAWECAAEEARTRAEQHETRLHAELERLALESERWTARLRELEGDRDQWRGIAGSLNTRVADALADVAAIDARRAKWERATEEARSAIGQVEARLRGELEELAQDRDDWRTRAAEYEQDLDRWRERAGSAEQGQVTLSERLDAALASVAAAEAQREALERAAEEARSTARDLETLLQAELQQLAVDRENWRTRASEYEQDRDRWRERAGSAERERASLGARLDAARADAAEAGVKREASERAAEEARTAGAQLGTRLDAESERAALERDSWRTRVSGYERDRDHWRELARDLDARVEAASAAAERQRQTWERATEEARSAVGELEERLKGELGQLALERDNWRRGASEYEEDRDRWRERAGRAEQEQATLNERLEAALAATVAAEAPRASARRWRAFSQFGSWLARGRVGYVRRYFALRHSFDYEAYLAANGDVMAAGLHPLLHYVEHGAREGRALPTVASTESTQLALPPPAEPRPRGERPDADAAPDAIAAFLERSGLIDEDFYRSEYPEVESSDLTPAQHYCRLGWREGRRPNAYFDPEWFLERYRDAASEATNPLWDYVLAEGACRPCSYFDPAFYAARYGLPSAEGALADFLEHRKRREWRDPIDLFDTEFYLAHNPDIAAAGCDPFLHYLSTGHREARDPSAGFSTAAYRGERLEGSRDDNPLIHHYETVEGAVSVAPPQIPTVADELRFWVRPGPEFEEFDAEITGGTAPRTKAIAFYLPQFHAIPENDAWWGNGFTEWANVTRGCPRYAGHYQPRLPRDLGFYDLDAEETLPRQVELARAAGIHGFSFYYYWFDGKRLLERPLDRFLQAPAIDFPFCLTWANENWTRRWDGHDDEILIAQRYDPGYDVALVDDLQRHFVDPRYIRLQGRPLFLLYRADCIPDAARRIERWRELWQSRHGEEPLILVGQAFGSEDPNVFGLDGAFELPPHKVVAGLHPINSQLTVLDGNFRGHVVAYDDVVSEALAEAPSEYPVIKTAVPSWDNEARRQGAGLTLHGSTPTTYERWVRALADCAVRQPAFGEPLVFLNAWNEWAEGAYLEPDMHYGAAYLNATARALTTPPTAKRKVLLVGHDAHRHGAQMIVRHIGETLSSQFGCEVAWLLLGGGAMVPEYEWIGRVWMADDDPERIAGVVAELRRDGFELAVVNTTLSGVAVPHLKAAGFRVVSLVHELPGIVGELRAEESLASVLDQSDTVVVPAENVARAITSGSSPDVVERIVVRPQGLYAQLKEPPDARTSLRDRLGIGADSRIVLNVGFGDLRKGIDTFVHVAKLAAAQAEDIHFVWVGNLHRDAERWLRADAGAVARERIHFVPYEQDVAEFYFGADAFFLSSREDPFPSVVLEALSAGLPVVGLVATSGAEELIAEHGRLVDRDDLAGVVSALDEAMREDDEQARVLRSQVVEERFRYDDYCFDLLRLLEPELEAVSVVVPNYNYARYVSDRMHSIFDQTYPVFETLVLDDCSTDDSLVRLDGIATTSARRFRVITNEENSGSPFAQWERGCRLARGKYVWIAEADDGSDPRFLEELVTRQRRDGASFAFSDSIPVDERGAELATSYKAYYRESVGSLMDSSFVLDGRSFLERCLAERNLVLNASAVVWEREALLNALDASRDALQEYRLAADWHLYAAAAWSAPRVAYLASPLNVHRRHDSSVTATLNGHEHVEEIERVQGFVAEMLGDNDTARRRMRAYANTLRDQFSVAAHRPAENDGPTDR